MIFSTSSIKKVYFGLITIISLFGNNLHSSEKGFITCRPCGGGRLGNQMFSIAATLSIAIDENINAYFPYLNQVRNADTPMNKEKIFWRLNNSFPPKSPKHTIIGVGDNKKKNNLRMSGKFKDGVCSRLQCWSENHFIHNKEKILPLFDPSDEILEDLTSRYEEIISHPSSVAIHVRTLKGEDHAKGQRPLYGSKFVVKAMSYFPDDSLFVVFSDDIDWCQEHLSHLSPNMEFIRNEPYYNDFYLMTLCKHNIVSNSTFSWWGAYLNKNPKKLVVAPKVFYNSKSKRKGLEDLWPKSWTLINGHWE